MVGWWGEVEGWMGGGGMVVRRLYRLENAIKVWLYRGEREIGVTFYENIPPLYNMHTMYSHLC